MSFVKICAMNVVLYLTIENNFSPHYPYLHYGPGVDSASNKNEYLSCGVKAAGA
jgi:hypothetical protein